MTSNISHKVDIRYCVASILIFFIGTFVFFYVNDLYTIKGVKDIPKQDSVVETEDLLQENCALAPEDIYVGVFINRIAKLDVSESTFYADFYLWFRWKSEKQEYMNNPIDNAEDACKRGGGGKGKQKRCLNFEFMNNRGTLRVVDETSEENAWDAKTGTNYKVYRVFGDFMFHHNFQEYPYDQLTLSIQLEETVAETDAVRYLPDPDSRISSDLATSGWEMNRTRLVTDGSVYYSDFGQGGEDGASMYPRASLELKFDRIAFAYLLKNLLPLIVIVFVANIIFFITPSEVGARSGFCASALLTAIALHLTVSSALPSIGYSTLMDKYFLAAFTFIGLASIQMVYTSKIYKDALAKAVYLNHISGIVFPLLFFAVLLGLPWLNR